MTTAEKLTAVAENQQAVYDAGKQAGFDWEAYQDGGNRTNYDYAFVRCWNDDFYHPIYPITGRVTQAFFVSRITNVKVPIIATGNLNSVWQSSEVVTIPYLDVSGVTSINLPFYGATKLTNINFVGQLKVNGMDLSSSPKVTHQSLLSLLNCLEDKTGDTSGTQWVVTLGKTNKAKLTDEELAIAENKGWAVK
ncbi:MAG: hypothetical protein E7527_06155 [Ruminococcaceae bacterium]|nr:hypothetical protein [Oscillospiraceae bacterium]